MGADYVLNQNDSDLIEKLTKLQKTVNPTIGFDAVGGDVSGAVFETLGQNGIMHVIDYLSEEKCNMISPLGLIFMNKKIKSLILPGWLDSKSTWKKASIMTEVLELLNGPLATQILCEKPMEQIKEALNEHKESMGKGKIILSHKFSQ